MMNKIAPVWALFALVVFATGTVWVRLYIIRTTYTINDVNQKIETAHREAEGLKLRLADLKSPKKLEEVARKRFGFSQPRIEQVVHFAKGVKGGKSGDGI
jgi:cell division protein FtsL